MQTDLHVDPSTDDEPMPSTRPAHVPTRHKPRGFAAMDPVKRREISRLGGRAAHAAGTAHQFTSDEARRAGRKGGQAPHVVRGRGKRGTSSGTPAAA
jgi:uncharacterized protein